MKKAFSLIELVVAISLSAIFLSALFLFFNFYIKLYKDVSAETARQAAALYCLEQVSREIKNNTGAVWEYKNNKIAKIVNGKAQYLSDEDEIDSFSIKRSNTFVSVEVNGLCLTLCPRN